jgi:hypothetical protein
MPILKQKYTGRLSGDQLTATAATIIIIIFTFFHRSSMPYATPINNKLFS